MAETYPLVILYDGVCGLCNRTVQFVLKRDRRRRFRFAPLQGEFASQILARHGRDPADLDTLYLVRNAESPTESLLAKGRAVLAIGRELGSVWRVLASIAGILPTRFLNFSYDQVARRRYRWFGKLEACPIPKKEERDRFIGL